MEPPRMLHACMLYQGGVPVTGGKVRPGKVAKERDYIIGHLDSAQVVESTGGELLVDFAGTQLLNFNTGRWWQ